MDSVCLLGSVRAVSYTHLMGFVHCVDDEQDAKTILSGSIWKYIKSLKDSGAVRHIGLSSHNPEIVKRFLDTGLIDMVMFSINPAYDYSTGDYGIGSVSKRASLYRACEQAGVGISVMLSLIHIFIPQSVYCNYFKIIAPLKFASKLRHIYINRPET